MVLRPPRRRAYEGGKFYSQPAVDVNVNDIYFPTPAPGQLGSLNPVASGELLFPEVRTFALPAEG